MLSSPPAARLPHREAHLRLLSKSQDDRIVKTLKKPELPRKHMVRGSGDMDIISFSI